MEWKEDGGNDGGILETAEGKLVVERAEKLNESPATEMVELAKEVETKILEDPQVIECSLAGKEDEERTQEERREEQWVCTTT